MCVGDSAPPVCLAQKAQLPALPSLLLPQPTTAWVYYCCYSQSLMTWCEVSLYFEMPSKVTLASVGAVTTAYPFY